MFNEGSVCLKSEVIPLATFTVDLKVRLDLDVRGEFVSTSEVLFDVVELYEVEHGDFGTGGFIVENFLGPDEEAGLYELDDFVFLAGDCLEVGLGFCKVSRHLQVLSILIELKELMKILLEKDFGDIVFETRDVGISV